MHVSERGVALVAEFEGFRSRPYQDAVGVWTIGYGETRSVGPHTSPVTESQAKAMLRRRLDTDFAEAIRALGLPLTQNQFDALVSFAYNVGPGGVAASTGVGRALRAHDWQAAADHLLDWDKAGGRALPGLTRRRHAERALFLARSHRAQHFAGYPKDEVTWIREYDRHPHDQRRRVYLRRAMTTRRKAIWQAAQRSGWDAHRRRERYRSLRARTS